MQYLWVFAASFVFKCLHWIGFFKTQNKNFDDIKTENINKDESKIVK